MTAHCTFQSNHKCQELNVILKKCEKSASLKISILPCMRTNKQAQSRIYKETDSKPSSQAKDTSDDHASVLIFRTCKTRCSQTKMQMQTVIMDLHVV